MEINGAIREAIKSICRELLFDSSLRCEVISVDKEEKTITAKSLKEELRYEHIKLIAQNGSGIITYPVIGSTVHISFIDGIDTMAFVSQYSQIEGYSIELQSGIKLELTSDGAVFNGGGKGGMVTAQDIVSKLNTLEQRMATHQHIVGSLGAPTAPDPATNPPIELTNPASIQNTKVKHG